MDNIIPILGSDLSSRKSAAIVRDHILKSVTSDAKVTVDLSTVLSISESYADEAFGVLVVANGIEWFVLNIQLSAARDSVLKTIAQVIQRRLNEANAPSARPACHNYAYG